MLAAAAAFSPSFAFVLLGAPRFERLRANVKVRVFLDGAGPAAIGVIAGSAVSLAPALTEPWQHPVLDGILLLALHPASCSPCSPRPPPASTIAGIRGSRPQAFDDNADDRPSTVDSHAACVVPRVSCAREPSVKHLSCAEASRDSLRLSRAPGPDR